MKADNVFDVVTSFRADLILLDVKLGDQVGRDMCLKLKSDAETNFIKVILFLAFPGTGVECAKYGADYFVMTPYELNDLVEKIRSCLDCFPVTKN